MAGKGEGKGGKKGGKGSFSKHRKYDKGLREAHIEQMEMFENMERSLWDAVGSESTQAIAGLVETAHSAIAQTFDDTEGRLLNNQKISRLVEHVLEHSAPVQLRGFFFKLRGRARALMRGRTSSRVMETLYRRCADVLLAGTGSAPDDSGLPTVPALLGGVVEELTESAEWGERFADLVQDIGCSWAMRALLWVLGGRVPPPPQGQEPEAGQKRKRAAAEEEEQQRFEPPLGGQPLAAFCAALAKAASTGKVFARWVNAPATCGVVCVAVQVDDTLHPVLADKEAFFELLQSSVSARVVEAALGTESGYRRVHKRLRKKWAKAVSCGHGRHAVEKWLASAPSAEALGEALGAVTPEVIVTHAAWAVLSGALQGAHRHPEQCRPAAELCLAVGTKLAEGGCPVTGLLDIPVRGMGPHIVRALLELGAEHAREAFEGVAAMGGKGIGSLARVPGGSFVVEAFLKGCSHKQAGQLLGALKGQLAGLAAEPSGCFVLQSMFEKCRAADRRRMAEELGHSRKELEGTKHGSVLSIALRLDQLQHRPGDWEEAERRQQRKEKLLSSILSTGPVADAPFQGSIAYPDRPKRVRRRRVVLV